MRPVRYQAFIITGAAAGLIAAVVLVLMGDPSATQYTGGSVLGYFAVFFGIVGAILGGFVGVVIETVQRRRAERDTRRGPA
jgi:hypothetical protein